MDDYWLSAFTTGLAPSLDFLSFQEKEKNELGRAKGGGSLNIRLKKTNGVRALEAFWK